MKWEYKVDYIGDKIEYCEWELNNAGLDGWELVGIYRDANKWYAVYKRPKK